MARIGQGSPKGVTPVTFFFVLFAILLQAPTSVSSELGSRMDSLLSDRLFSRAGDSLEAGSYAEAESLYRAALKIQRSDLPPPHPAVVLSLTGLGRVLRYLEKYDEAERSLREAASAARKLVPPDSSMLAESLGLLGSLLWHRRAIEEAEPLLRESLAIRRQANEPGNPEIAAGIHDLALLLGGIGRYAEAESLHREALAIRRAAYGEEHLEVASSLINLGLVLRDRGDYPGAEGFLREELRLRRKLRGEEHPDVANSLDNLGLLLMWEGRHGEAEVFLQAAVALHRKLHGASHTDLANSLANLGWLRAYQGRPAAAAPLIREALSIRARTLGADHPVTAQTLHQLGLVLWSLGRQEEAHRMILDSIERTAEKLGRDHQDTAAMLHNLALFYWDREDLSLAEETFREQEAVLRGIHGSEHPLVALCLANRASLVIEQGRFEEGGRIAQEALAIGRSVLGEEDPRLGWCYRALGRAHLGSRRLAKAAKALEKSGEIYEAARIRVGTGWTRATFESSPYPDLAVTLLFQGKHRDAWRAIERHHGRLLLDLRHGGAGQSDADRTESDSLLARISDLERQLDVLTGAVRADPDLRSRLRDAELALEEARAARVAGTLGAVRRAPRLEVFVDLEEVQSAIPEKTALLGWLDLRLSAEESLSWAYLIVHGGAVQWIELPASADGISSFDLADRFRRTLEGAPTLLGTTRTKEWRETSRLLSECRIGPLLPRLEGIDRLLVVPSGVMLGLPVEALMDREDRPLLDRFVISLVPSASLFAQFRRSGDSEERLESALLIGDPDFGGSSDVAGGSQLAERLWPLPGTREEIQAISSRFPVREVFLGKEASEATLVDLERDGRLEQFDVLHLATHALIDGAAPERSSLVLSRIPFEERLQQVLNGLSPQDGLLTAGEIAREWSLSADLVTLSACRTALGSAIPGEGHLGLAHAFLEAGARSVLVSLWEVDDQATRVLMEGFYDVLLDSSKATTSRARALRMAKHRLRSFVDERGRTPYAHPSYWAAFVLLGDGG